jgi:cell division protein FtsI (penicillin-binding protein 3)
VLVLLDEPQPLAETMGFATSGWNAAPTAAKVINRIAPMLGLAPRFDLPPADQLILAKIKSGR